MKLSIHDFDKYDEQTKNLTRRARIFLDGLEVKNVTVVNEEEGYIMRYATDADGHLVVKDDELVEQRVDGKVKIVDPQIHNVGQLA